tara:strand:- start:1194 stop:2222 length:1029 start_codon:yes stop_codon:yes gene_type:complete
MATYTKLQSGNWRAQVRKIGLYRAKTFKLKRDAHAWATKIEAQIDQSDAGLISPSGSLAELIDEYQKTTPARGRSWGNYLAAWRVDLGHVKLSKLSRAHIQQWVDGKLVGGTKAVTLAGYLSTLGKVLDWARYSRGLDTTGDICREVRSALSHAGHKTRSNERDRIPTDVEIDRLREYWATQPKQLIPMAELVEFAISTAMRQAEITRIRFEDVDWARQTVIIRDRKHPTEKQGNDMMVPLIGKAWDIVQARRGDRENPTGRIFPYNSRSMSAAFTRTTTRLKINNLRFHDLRHAGITNLFKLGLPIELVSICSGHRDWKMLRRYTQLTADDVLARVKELTN